MTSAKYWNALSAKANVTRWWITQYQPTMRTISVFWLEEMQMLRIQDKSLFHKQPIQNEMWNQARPSYTMNVVSSLQHHTHDAYTNSCKLVPSERGDCVCLCSVREWIKSKAVEKLENCLVTHNCWKQNNAKWQPAAKAAREQGKTKNSKHNGTKTMNE